LLPTITPLPVTWQTRAIVHSLNMFQTWKNESIARKMK
jgi:hypothetical protein